MKDSTPALCCFVSAGAATMGCREHDPNRTVRSGALCVVLLITRHSCRSTDLQAAVQVFIGRADATEPDPPSRLPSQSASPAEIQARLPRCFCTSWSMLL